MANEALSINRHGDGSQMTGKGGVKIVKALLCMAIQQCRKRRTLILTREGGENK